MENNLNLNNEFWQKKPRILVTGSSGLVGSAIKSCVLRGTSDVSSCFVFATSKDADLCKFDECEELFEKHKPTHVIHLAAMVGGLFKNKRFPVDFWTTNVSINNNILSCSHKYNVQKVVSCLSTCIFPDKTSYPINEEMIHDGPPHPSNEPYAYAKRMVDVLNRAYHRQFGRKFTSIVPTNVYGPKDNFSLEDGHVIPSLIHKCYLAKKNGTPFKVLGSGKPLRQFVYSEDLALAIIQLLQVYDEVSPVIVSVDEKDEVTISEVANLIAGMMEFKGKIEWDKSKADGQYKKTANNSKMMGILPDFKFRSMRDGLREACNWFKENYETARK